MKMWDALKEEVSTEKFWKDNTVMALGGALVAFVCGATIDVLFRKYRKNK